MTPQERLQDAKLQLQELQDSPEVNAERIAALAESIKLLDNARDPDHLVQLLDQLLPEEDEEDEDDDKLAELTKRMQSLNLRSRRATQASSRMSIQAHAGASAVFGAGPFFSPFASATTGAAGAAPFLPATAAAAAEADATMLAFAPPPGLAEPPSLMTVPPERLAHVLRLSVPSLNAGFQRFATLLRHGALAGQLTQQEARLFCVRTLESTPHADWAVRVCHWVEAPAECSGRGFVEGFLAMLRAHLGGDAQLESRIQAFYEFEQQSSELVTAYLARFDNELEAVGHVHNSDEHRTRLFLKGLNDEQAKAYLLNRSPLTMPSIRHFVTMYAAHVLAWQSAHKPARAAATTTVAAVAPQSSTDLVAEVLAAVRAELGPRSPRCWNCGARGHFARSCKEPKRERANEKN